MRNENLLLGRHSSLQIWVWPHGSMSSPRNNQDQCQPSSLGPESTLHTMCTKTRKIHWRMSRAHLWERVCIWYICTFMCVLLYVWGCVFMYVQVHVLRTEDNSKVFFRYPSLLSLVQSSSSRLGWLYSKPQVIYPSLPLQCSDFKCAPPCLPFLCGFWWLNSGTACTSTEPSLQLKFLKILHHTC